MTAIYGTNYRAIARTSHDISPFEERMLGELALAPEPLGRSTVSAEERERLLHAFKSVEKWSDVADSISRPYAIWPEPEYTHDFAHISEYAQSPLIQINEPSRVRRFNLNFENIELLLERNSFEITSDESKFILALRGCVITRQLEQQDVRTLELEWIYPDHYDLKCVCIVADRESRLLSAYTASTVPHMSHMFTQRALNPAYENTSCNMLLSGLYRYLVGPHRNVPGALRLASDPVVMRCDSDALRYDLSIRLVTFAQSAQDNVHPAWTNENINERFNSAGCIVVDGSSTRREPAGRWRDFRAKLGLEDLGSRTGSDAGLRSRDDNRNFDLALLSGLEAFLMSTSENFSESYWRIRYGSGSRTENAASKRVKAVQKHIGAAADGRFGPNSLIASLRNERDAGGSLFATGILRVDEFGLVI